MTSGKKWFFLCLALVFCIGFLSGIIFCLTTNRPMRGHFMGMGKDRGMPMDMGMRGGPGGIPPPPMGDRGGGEDGIKNHVIDEMGRELSLTDDQKKKLKAIFDENEPQQLAFHEQMKKQFEDFRKKMDTQIIQMLDDKQKEKFKEFTHRFDEH